jgi:hypothetical protein
VEELEQVQVYLLPLVVEKQIHLELELKHQ